MKIYEFTRDVPEEQKEETVEEDANWDEEKAKVAKHVACKQCRYFILGCSSNYGQWHKTCKEFEWD